MCVFAGPADAINTTISNTLMQHPDHPSKWIHVLGYQNAVRDARINWNPDTGFLTPELRHELKTAQGNAMILPFPTAEEMGPWNVIDISVPTSLVAGRNPDNPLPVFRHVLADQVSVTQMRSLGVHGGSGSVTVFDVGIYTVVMGNDPHLVKLAIDRYVDPRKRPPFRPDFFEYYHKRYQLPNGQPWQIAWCCFNTADLAAQAEDYASAEPMLWWYEPINPWVFFYPGLDAHNGDFPKQPARGILRSHNFVAALHATEDNRDVMDELNASVHEDRVFGKRGSFPFEGLQVTYRPLEDADGKLIKKDGGLISKNHAHLFKPTELIRVVDTPLHRYLPNVVVGMSDFNTRTPNCDWYLTFGAMVNNNVRTKLMPVQPEKFPFEHRPDFRPDPGRPQ